MKKVALTIATLTLAGAACATEHKVFRWSPDDLTTLESIALTHERIEAQARDFCRDHLDGTLGLSAWRDCIAAVTEEIVQSVDDQRLTAYAKTGTVDEALLAAVPGRSKST